MSQGRSLTLFGLSCIIATGCPGNPVTNGISRYLQNWTAFSRDLDKGRIFCRRVDLRSRGAACASTVTVKVASLYRGAWFRTRANGGGSHSSIHRRRRWLVSVYVEYNYPQSYEDLNDEEVVAFARDGDVVALEYLIHKYKNFVRAKARSYFLIGADREDIIQEGMIGLYKAIRDFRADKLASFRAFAELCITRQIITAIKTATRQKHIPLNSYVSLNKPLYDDESDRTLE